MTNLWQPVNAISKAFKAPATRLVCCVISRAFAMQKKKKKKIRERVGKAEERLHTSYTLLFNLLPLKVP